MWPVVCILMRGHQDYIDSCILNIPVLLSNLWWWRGVTCGQKPAGKCGQAWLASATIIVIVYDFWTPHNVYVTMHAKGRAWEQGYMYLFSLRTMYTCNWVSNKQRNLLRYSAKITDIIDSTLHVATQGRPARIQWDSATRGMHAK